LLLAEGSILRVVLPKLRETPSGERDPVSHHRRQETLGHEVAERLVPGTDRGADQHMPQHAARYAWALRACEGRRVVDLGCGAGYGTVILSSFARSVVGLDVSEDAVELARSLYPSIDFRVASLVEDELPEADIAVCFEVLEHLEAPERALERFFETYPRVLLSLPNPLAGGSHINPHHLVDWPLTTLKRKLKDAGAKELVIRRQGYFSPSVRRWRPAPSISWVIDASREAAT
jgi:SAM-dependent methyltransferase